MRKKERESQRKMTAWAIGLLIVVISLLGFAVMQTVDAMEYINAIEKELPVTADSSASEVGHTKNITYILNDDGRDVK